MQESPATEAVKAVVMAALANAKRGQKAEIARRAGVEPPAVTKWTKGETCPSPDYWGTLEEVLDDLSPGELGEVAASAGRHPAAVGGFLTTADAVLQRLLLEIGRLGGEVWDRTKSMRGPEVRPDLHATFHEDGTGREFLFEMRYETYQGEALRHGIIDLLWTEYVLMAQAVKVLIVGREVEQLQFELSLNFIADLGVDDFHLVRADDILEGDEWRAAIFGEELEHVSRYYAQQYATAADADTLEGKAPQQKATRPSPPPEE